MTQGAMKLRRRRLEEAATKSPSWTKFMRTSPSMKSWRCRPSRTVEEKAAVQSVSFVHRRAKVARSLLAGFLGKRCRRLCAVSASSCRFPLVAPLDPPCRCLNAGVRTYWGLAVAASGLRTSQPDAAPKSPRSCAPVYAVVTEDGCDKGFRSTRCSAWGQCSSPVPLARLEARCRRQVGSKSRGRRRGKFQELVHAVTGFQRCLLRVRDPRDRQLQNSSLQASSTSSTVER